MAFEFDNMFDINNKKSQSLYNPNDITKTASAGIGSGNPVQSAQQKQQNMTQGQNMQSNPYLNNSWYGGGGGDIRLRGQLKGNDIFLSNVKSRIDRMRFV